MPAAPHTTARGGTDSLAFVLNAQCSADARASAMAPCAMELPPPWHMQAITNDADIRFVNALSKKSAKRWGDGESIAADFATQEECEFRRQLRLDDDEEVVRRVGNTFGLTGDEEIYLSRALLRKGQSNTVRHNKQDTSAGHQRDHTDVLESTVEKCGDIGIGFLTGDAGTRLWINRGDDVCDGTAELYNIPPNMVITVPGDKGTHAGATFFDVF